jgi:hypothetical protein
MLYRLWMSILLLMLSPPDMQYTKGLTFVLNKQSLVIIIIFFINNHYCFDIET